MSYLENFLIQLSATFIAVIIGIPIALWLNRKYTEYKKREEKNSLIDFLNQNLKENLRLIEDMKKHFSNGIVIFYNVDLASWSLISQKVQLLDDTDLQKKIFSLYYKLEHLSRKIDRQFEMHYSAFQAMGNYQKQRAGLIESIVKHIDVIKEDISEILKELQNHPKANF